MTVLTWVILFGFTALVVAAFPKELVILFPVRIDYFLTSLNVVVQLKKKKALAHAEFCSSEKF